MSICVTLDEKQCRNKDLATLAWDFCPHYGTTSLVLPNEHYQRLTHRDPYQEGDFKMYSIGYARIKIMSNWQVRFATVLEKLKPKYI
jgi:hypothetical protein